MLSSPSSAIMASDSRRPYSIGIEGVYGKYPVAFALIMSPKSKKTRGHLACSRAASALGLAQTSPSPAGSIRPFCDPVMTRSTFHSSMRKSIEPMELTPSTYSRAGCCAASIALRTAATSLVTPVAVSLWTMRIPLISCCWSCVRISPIRSDGAPSPHSTSMMSTRKPCRWARSIHRWLNWPYRGASTRSPGESVLTSAASHPPVPVAGKMNACPVVVLKTFPRSRNRPVASSGNAEERWSSIARFMARRIRSGTFVGPGTNRKLRPGIKSVLNEREKHSEWLRYSATSVPQPLGWVGASPPKLRGANSLAPFQLCLSYRRRATGIGVGADTDPHDHSSASVRADRRRRHSSTPRSTRAAADVDRRLNAPVPAHGLQLLPVDRSWRRYRNARRHHFGARTYSASLFPAARGNKLERR